MLNADPIRVQFQNDVVMLSTGGDVQWGDSALGNQRSIAALKEPPPTILVVADCDDCLAELSALLDQEGHRFLIARSAGRAREILRQSPIDMMIVDMVLPDSCGLDFCRGIRADRRTELTQVLMVSGIEAVDHEIDCIRSGADAYLSRPYHPQAFSARVASLLRRNAAMNRLEESEAILVSLAKTVEQRDTVTACHCDRLAALCVGIGMGMGLPNHNLLSLYRGGYLHDIGKIGMPDSILFKPGPLTEEEWRIMRTHTLKGEEICRPMKGLAPVLPIIRSHHERWDGSGYPDGLAGRNIPLLARVLQLADIYDALTSERPYKAAMSTSAALGVMQEETDRGWRDPDLMRSFLKLRHEKLLDAAGRYAEEGQDAHVMKESLENLRLAILA